MQHDPRGAPEELIDEVHVYLTCTIFSYDHLMRLKPTPSRNILDNLIAAAIEHDLSNKVRTSFQPIDITPQSRMILSTKSELLSNPSI